METARKMIVLHHAFRKKVLMNQIYSEIEACNPVIPCDLHLNPNVVLPYGLTGVHVFKAMLDFVEFLQLINQSVHKKEMPRLESFIMQANFSSIVGEFMSSIIPKYCKSVVKNRYHNGHPDLIPSGLFENDSVQHDHRGIEVKGSRYLQAWQGHNAEKTFLMVFIFDSNRPPDASLGIGPKPFRFLKVLCAYLEEEDWKFSGRSPTSRRTITASVKPQGAQKMYANWIYDENSPNGIRSV